VEIRRQRRVAPVSDNRALIWAGLVLPNESDGSRSGKREIDGAGLEAGAGFTAVSSQTKRSCNMEFGNGFGLPLAPEVVDAGKP